MMHSSHKQNYRKTNLELIIVVANLSPSTQITSTTVSASNYSLRKPREIKEINIVVYYNTK